MLPSPDYATTSPGVSTNLGLHLLVALLVLLGASLFLGLILWLAVRLLGSAGSQGQNESGSFLWGDLVLVGDPAPQVSLPTPASVGTLEDAPGLQVTQGEQAGRAPTEPEAGPMTVHHFREVAHAYRDAFGEGRPPTLAVKEHFGVSYATAARWVAIARNDYGLLPKTKRGRATA